MLTRTEALTAIRMWFGSTSVIVGFWVQAISNLAIIELRISISMSNRMHFRIDVAIYFTFSCALELPMCNLLIDCSYIDMVNFILIEQHFFIYLFIFFFWWSREFGIKVWICVYDRLMHFESYTLFLFYQNNFIITASPKFPQN